MAPDRTPSARRANDKQRRYRSDGTPVWSKPSIAGPGIWASCVKGKEKQAVGELYDLFDALAEQLYPGSGPDTANGGPPAAAGEGAPTRAQPSGADEADGSDDGLSIEQQIAREMAVLTRPRREQLFSNCMTNTPCVFFIACKPPIDPVALVQAHVENVLRTGVTRTKNVHRLVPVSSSCLANIQDIQGLCRKVFADSPLSATGGAKHRYKIELRVRNHKTLSRQTIIQEIAKCVPEGHTVDLENAEVFVLVEIFKSVCGISVVKDYYKHQKFNVVELANTVASATTDDVPGAVGGDQRE